MSSVYLTESSSMEVDFQSSSLDTSLSSKYDPVRMGKEDCIKRIKEVARKLNAQISQKEDVKFDCPVTHCTMESPTILNCSHTFEKSVVDQVNICPTCRAPVTNPKPNLFVKGLIDEWKKEERIPTLSHFKKENRKLAEIYLEAAKSATDNEEILDAYKSAFLHTKRSEDYAALPLFYERAGKPKKAALAYLHLALRQFEENKVQEAIKTLEHCKTISPIPIKIDALLLAHYLSLNPTPQQIEEVMKIAAVQTDPEEAISIYKEVITYDPWHRAYMALCHLLKDPKEKSYFLLKAADYADQKGESELAMHLRKEAEACFKPPTSISQEDWANPAAFLEKLPPKPQALLAFLAGPCPIYGNEGKTAAETHIVVPLIKNISKTINGAPVTGPRILGNLNNLDRTSGGLGCRFIWYKILNPEVDKPSEVEFEWAVMTRGILPDSEYKSYDFQKQLAESKGYEVPGFLDAATCILWENRYSGDRLYGDSPWIYTRCHEVIDGYHLVVGGFASSGLSVSYDHAGDGGNVGVAGLRKF